MNVTAAHVELRDIVTIDNYGGQRYEVIGALVTLTLRNERSSGPATVFMRADHCTVVDHPCQHRSGQDQLWTELFPPTMTEVHCPGCGKKLR
jgi:hypothetical protein